MRNGYDKFFETAKKHAKEKQLRPQPKPPGAREPVKDFSKRKISISSDLQIEASRARKTKGKGSLPIVLLCSISMAFVSLGYVFLHIDEIDAYISKIEIGFFESSRAQSERPLPSDPEVKKSAEPMAQQKDKNASTGTEGATSSEEPKDHFRVLAERKKQLDEREAELLRVETELNEQKKELEKKMQELEQTRRSISSILEERVKLDEQRVETLVQMYSRMRPPQAAKVFETMDEGLAIEILGRMKKDVAANIMNLIKPEKAQAFSEKFAGYKAK